MILENKYNLFNPEKPLEKYPIDKEGFLNNCFGKIYSPKNIVYFLYGERKDNHELLLFYIGKTTRGIERILEHEKKGYAIRMWLYLEVPEEKQDEIERYFIQKCQPKLNFVDNPKYFDSNLNRYKKTRAQLGEMRREEIEKMSEEFITSDMIFLNEYDQSSYEKALHTLDALCGKQKIK